MRTKDYGEQLLDILLDMCDSAAADLPCTNCPEAYQLAGQVVCELEWAKERVARLEAAIRRMVEAGGIVEFQREFDAAKNILRRGRRHE